MTLSRRAFLQVAGTSAFTVAGATSWGLWRAATQTSLGGAQALVPMMRAFGPTAVLAAPHAAARVVYTAWPDALLPLPPQDTAVTDTDGHIHVTGGYVPTHAVQPVLAGHTTPAALPGAWAQLHGPSAVLRTDASADATPLARVGWGAVLWCDDMLPGEHDGHLRLTWLAADGTPRAAWTPARAWHRAPMPTAPGRDVTVQLGRATRTLTLWVDDAPVLSAPFAPHASLRAGQADVTFGAAGATLGEHVGAPTLHHIGDAALVGVTWHNAFDRAPSHAASQMPAWAAHALAFWQPTRALVT